MTLSWKLTSEQNGQTHIHKPLGERGCTPVCSLRAYIVILNSTIDTISTITNYYIVTISNYASLFNTITLNVFLTFYICTHTQTHTFFFQFSPFFLKRAHCWPREIKPASHSTPDDFIFVTTKGIITCFWGFSIHFYKMENIIAHSGTDTAPPIKMEAASKKLQLGRTQCPNNGLYNDLTWPFIWKSPKFCKHRGLELSMSNLWRCCHTKA